MNKNPLGAPDALIQRLFVMVTVCAISLPTAAAQPSCNLGTIDLASGAYRHGRFDQAIRLLNPCAPAGFGTREERIDAYRLMALSYIATDSMEHARGWVKRLVELDARHRTDPSLDPPLFVQYVQDLRPRWYTWLWKGGAWYKWAGRGLVVAGIVALPVVLRGDPKVDLPGPPAFPGN